MGRFLQARVPGRAHRARRSRRLGARATGSRPASSAPTTGYQVEGIGSSQPPAILDRSVIDAAERVTDEESFAMARRLMREEGLLVGGSAGTAVVAALRVAARGGSTGRWWRCCPTRWDRYLSTDWLRAL